MSQTHPHTPPPALARRRTLWLTLALGSIIVLGAALRIPRLADVPPGLWFDEALNGRDAVAVWRGDEHGERGLRLVYPGEFPREPMFETLLALAVGLGGPGVPILRMVPVVIGLLTILLLYEMIRGELGWSAALASAAVLATLFWHALFSRLVFRAIVLPPWIIGIVWTALACRRNPTRPRMALLGALIGGGFYTYLAWYFMAPLVIGLVIWVIRLGRGLRERLTRAGLILGFALLVFAPLGLDYARHPAHLLARAADPSVSVFAGGAADALRELGGNVIDALLMFHVRGDLNPRLNLPGRPALDPIQGVFFLVGLVICGLWMRRADRRAIAWILLGWIVCGMLPSIFTRTQAGSPHFLRMLVMTPAVAAVVGIGLDAMARWLARRARRPFAVALVTGLILMSGAMTANALYQRWAHDPDVWRGFHGDLRQLVELGCNAPGDVAVFVPQFLYEHRSFQFQTLNCRSHILPYADWSMLKPWAEVPGHDGRPEPNQRWIVVTANNGLLDPLRRLIPSGHVAQAFQAPESNTWALAFAVPEQALPGPAQLDRLQREWRRDMRF